MSNLEVAQVLYELADLMEFRGDDPYKIRAYRRAADSILRLAAEVADLARAGRLLSIEGVGKSISELLKELLRTGTTAQLDALREAIPPGLVELTRVPGLGARTAAILHARLGIQSLEALEMAARQGQLRAVPGFGSKKEAQVLASLEQVKRRLQVAPLGAFLPLAGAVLAHMRAHPSVTDAALAGAVRRRQEVAAELVVVCAAGAPADALAHAARLSLGGGEVSRSSDHVTLMTGLGRPVTIRAVPPERFAAALLLYTGSDAHLTALHERAARLGYRLDQDGLTALPTGAPAPATTEADIYRLLGLPYIEPELREGRGEIEAAGDGRLPRLVALTDLKGDLHTHSRWSDGAATILEMAEGARTLGHRYLAITDHTKSLAIAGGLTPERVRLQGAEIARINRSFTDGFRILHGTEVDILKDGSLDLPDEVLRELDVVVASVHSHFRLDEAEMTERIMAAIRHPYVDIIGHPTGRLLTRREPYPLAVERLLELAARTGTAVEINASPDRLDLSDLHARLAKDRGVKIAINTDAHSVPELGFLGYGLGQARRAWLEPGDIINAMEPDALRIWLEREKG